MDAIKTKKLFFIWIYLVIVQCNAINEKEPRLEILPPQQIIKRPLGKPLLLTCTPNVEQKDLISDLKWRDNNNNTINPKQYGPPPLIYTEHLNANQLMLVITSLSESMAGNFYCSASYANSELLEEKVRIETYTAITWKDAPKIQTPVLGSDYVVKCIVTANPPPTVDWLRMGEQLKSSDRFVVKHDGLLIRNVSESDDGIYSCRAAVIQTGELSERGIRLDVQIKPTLEPLDREYEAIEGQEFSVICTANGKPLPQIQWIKDGKDMSKSDRFSVVPHNGQMSVTRIEENDRGTYKCIARNDAGIAEQEMSLIVVVKPKVYELKNITIPTNSEGILTCKAKGRPAPQITFRKWGTTHEYRLGNQEDDENIVLEQTYDDVDGQSTGSLIISRMERNHDGLYQCLARNKGDTAFEVGHITVEYPPNFDHMKDLPPVYSWEERVANLSCMAMGFPNATIEWRWNERLVREMQDKFLQIVEDGPRSDLLVRPVERRYFSAYKCIAVNRLGRAEHIMELREGRLPPPVAQAKPIEVTATAIRFEIIGPASDPGLPSKAFTVQYKEERNPDWNYALNRTWTVDTPYVVENLRPQTIYTFRFATRNDVGLGQWSAIRVQGTPSRSVPEPPKVLNQVIVQQPEDGELPIIVSVYPDKFDIIWSRPIDNGEPIDYYSIKFCPGSKINNVWNEIESLCRDRNFISYSYSSQLLSDLNPDTYYRVELTAHNAIGFSTPTNVYLKTSRGEETIAIGVSDEKIQISSLTIVGIAVLSILLLLVVIDFFCCVALDLGILAAITRKKDDRASRGAHQPLNNANNKRGGDGNNLMLEINSRTRQEDKFDLIGRNSAV